MFKEYVSKFQGANERERDEARPFLLSPSFLRRIFPVGSGNEKQSMP